MSGAGVARRCAAKFEKPLVVRQGYSQYEFARKKFGQYSLHSILAKLYEKRNLRSADAIICTTSSMAAGIADRTNIDRSRLFIVPNYVVQELWSPAHVARPIKEKCVLGFVGRLVKQKNLPRLIEAGKNLPVKFVFVGSGGDVQILRSLSAQHHVECEIVGRKPQNSVVDKLRECHAFVFPSIYEGHPKALIEAMTLGMPVLAADSPGISQEIVDDVSGILVQPTISGIRRGISRLLQMSIEDRVIMGQKARKITSQKYSLDKVFNLDLAVLNAALEKWHNKNPT
jgi:glycosyltransferase involved in cell wall biosynthesis